jgi:transposase-like protein
MNSLSNKCKKCSSQNIVKNGIVRQKQRYKCKNCGYNFTIGDAREKVRPEAKALAILLYGSCKASYGMIAKLFNVSRTTVLHWIRTIGKTLPIPEINTEVKEVQIDEMWHFIEKKTEGMDLASRGLC